MLGGYQAFKGTDYAEKTYENLPVHQVLRIKFTFTRVDALSHGLMYVDGAESWRRSFSYMESGAVDACGENWHSLYNEVQVHGDVTVVHSGPTATIRFAAKGAGDRGNFWGVQDVELITAIAHPSPPAPPSPPGIWHPGAVAEDRWPGATGWQGSSLSVTTCGLLGTMLGGFQVLGPSDYVEKTFTRLPAHHELRIQLVYSRIDRLAAGVFYVDGAEAWRRKFSYMEGQKPDSVFGSISMCGDLGHSLNNEIQVRADVVVPHVGENVTIRVGAESGGGWFGVQDVVVTTATSHPSPPVPPSPPGIWDTLEPERWPGARGWISNSPMTETGCGGSRLVGGFGVFGNGTYLQKTFDGLSHHTALRITARFYKIDKWASNRGELLVDGGTAWQSIPYTGHGTNLCGNSAWQHSELIAGIDVTVAHYASSTTLRFTTDITAPDMWWGVQDVNVQLITSHPSPPAPPSLPGVWSQVLYDVWPGASGWVGSVALSESTLSTCGILSTMVGGYEKLGASDYVEKPIGSLPTHSTLRIRAKFYKIDKWFNNRGQLLVDGTVVWQSIEYTGHGQDACGNAAWQNGDLEVDVDVTVAHTAESAVVRFTTDITSDVAFWGVNAVVVHVGGDA